MNIETTAYTTLNNSNVDNFKIHNFEKLTKEEAKQIRDIVNGCLQSNYQTIFLDTKNVTQVDLSGINEVIHSFYTLNGSSKNLVLAYRKNSIVEKWVQTTGLDNFIETALLPAA